jgi:hypothetical protein
MINGIATVTAIGGTLDYSFAWIGPGTYSATTQTIENLAAGTYTVTVTDANGCHSTCDIVVTEDPCVWDCNTAYGYKDAPNSICFFTDGFSQWGWTNKIGTETSTTFDLYAGAAGCVTSADKLAGIVQVDHFGSTVTVTYTLNPGYFMTEVHVYVGKDKYPLIGKKPTVAPGKYTYNAGSLDYLTTYTATITGKTGDLYVIAHAVTCKQVVPTPILPEAKRASITMGLKAKSLQVYPNPFSEQVVFEFVSAKDTHAVLEITNLVGQKITTLMDEDVKMGVLNRIKYQPRNVVTGILIYRLIMDGQVQNGRLIYRK